MAGATSIVLLFCHLLLVSYTFSCQNAAINFNGDPSFNCKNHASLKITDTKLPLEQGLCLEKIADGAYLDMVPHPDGSNRIFLASQQGLIWLATVPEEGSGIALVLDESNLFLNLTDIVHMDTEHGLMSIAFHPQFALNGLFFVSFNCDKIRWPECSGRCSCNADVSCDPSELGSQNGYMPCQYHSIIAEFTTNGIGSQTYLATRANPSEVRRIFTMGLPYTKDHAGQILFGPSDGYLYYIVADDGGDLYNFAQNKKSLHGKILRLDIDNIPSAEEIKDLGLWGNYSIPSDNPYVNDKEALPEIWALGFRNPWRCSFDSKRPSYFLCGDSGQNQFEEVDLVIKGGNYGWRFYEGTILFYPSQSPGENTSVSSINLIFPVMGYNHSTVNPNEGSASITGGYFYRSKTDPCLYGRYLYADLYGNAVWAGTESPKNSRKFTSTRLSFGCSHNSPIPCSSAMESPFSFLGYIFSMGEDNRKDIFILTSKGVYRISHPIHCNYTCSKESVRIANAAPSFDSLISSGSHLKGLYVEVFLLFFTSSLLMKKVLVL